MIFILGFANTNFSWILIATIVNFTTILKISRWNVPNDWSIIAWIVFYTIATIRIIFFMWIRILHLFRFGLYLELQEKITKRFFLFKLFHVFLQDY